LALFRPSPKRSKIIRSAQSPIFSSAIASNIQFQSIRSFRISSLGQALPPLSLASKSLRPLKKSDSAGSVRPSLNSRL
jgi:hypothetical protein